MLRSLPPSLAAALFCAGALAQAPGPAPVLPGLTEQRLANGADLILVSRPGTGAFRASLFFRQGGVDEPPQLLGATELLSRCLLGSAWPEDLKDDAGLVALQTGRGRLRLHCTGRQIFIGFRRNRLLRERREGRKQHENQQSDGRHRSKQL